MVESRANPGLEKNANLNNCARHITMVQVQIIILRNIQK